MARCSSSWVSQRRLLRTFVCKSEWNNSIAALFAAEATRPIEPTNSLFFKTRRKPLEKHPHHYVPRGSPLASAADLVDEWFWNGDRDSCADSIVVARFKVRRGTPLFGSGELRSTAVSCKHHEQDLRSTSCGTSIDGGPNLTRSLPKVMPVECPSPDPVW